MSHMKTIELDMKLRCMLEKIAFKLLIVTLQFKSCKGTTYASKRQGHT
jgi:hypothetical protein